MNVRLVRTESQHSIGAPTCHDFPRFVIISEKSRLEVVDDDHVFGKKDPLGPKGKFSKNYSERIHSFITVIYYSN